MPKGADTRGLAGIIAAAYDAGWLWYDGQKEGKLTPAVADGALCRSLRAAVGRSESCWHRMKSQRRGRCAESRVVTWCELNGNNQYGGETAAQDGAISCGRLIRVAKWVKAAEGLYVPQKQTMSCIFLPLGEQNYASPGAGRSRPMPAHG